MTEVEKDIEKKLNDVFQIKTGAVLNGDSNLRLELLANLLYLYDDSWSLEAGEGARVVVGHNYYSMQAEAEITNKPGVTKRLRRWLQLAELRHLVSDGGSLVDNKKFSRLVTGLMDRLEHKFGREGLRTRVRTVASSQAKARGKARSPRLTKKRPISSMGPLRTNTRDVPLPESEAEIIPPAAGKQLPRTPVGKQLPPESLIMEKAPQVPVVVNAAGSVPEQEERVNEPGPFLASAQLAEVETAPHDLPSGNYALPEEMEKIAINNESRKESQDSLVRIEEHQKKAEEVRRKKKEEAKLKRKKQEIENFARDEKRKIEEERRQLQESRKALMQQQKQLEMDKTKLKREEEKGKKKKQEIEEERRQLEKLRKALMQQQKQLEMDKTKLKREEMKVKRKSRMSDIHATNTNNRKSLLVPPPASSSHAQSNLHNQDMRRRRSKKTNIGIC